MNNRYEKILVSTKEIKSALMLSLVDTAPFQTQMPEEVAEEMKLLANIEGLVLKALVTRGVPYSPLPGKPGYVQAVLPSGAYIFHESALQSSPVAKAGGENVAKLPEETAISEATGQEFSAENEHASSGCERQQPIPGAKEPEPIDDEASDWSMYAPKHDKVQDDVQTEVQTEMQKEAEEAGVDISANSTPEEPVALPKPSSASGEETDAPISKATVIGGESESQPVVSPLARPEVFTAEKSIAVDDLIMDCYSVTVCHKGGPREEMQFMISPLKVHKFASPTVPIIVCVYYRGKIYTASSFDKNTDGRNTVEMNINEYYFVCRGSYNDKGEFQSQIVTTGISANQGDVLNLQSCKKYKPRRPVRTGHLKFKYATEFGPGVIEVFPFDASCTEFVIMARSEEFVDYYFLSDKPYGSSRVLLYDDGVKSEIVCSSDGEYLEADIVPV